MTNLPNLPRVLKKREASVTHRIMQAMLEHDKIASGGIEIKHVRGRTLHRGKLKYHQRQALLECVCAFKHKLSDIGRVQQPFDGFILKKAQAYLVIYYDLAHLHEPCQCYAIDIHKVPDGKVTIEYAREVGIRLFI